MNTSSRSHADIQRSTYMLDIILRDSGYQLSLPGQTQAQITSNNTINNMGQDEPQSIVETVELESQPITALFRDAVNDAEVAHDLYIMLKSHFTTVSRRYKNKHDAGDSLPTDDPIDRTFAKLLQQDPKKWADRDHILGTAAVAMENIVRNHMKAKRAAKRGGLAETVSLTGSDVIDARSAESSEHVEIHDLIERLSEEDSHLATILRMKNFGKMTYKEIGEALGQTKHQIEHSYKKSVAWVMRELNRE